MMELGDALEGKWDGSVELSAAGPGEDCKRAPGNRLPVEYSGLRLH